MTTPASSATQPGYRITRILGYLIFFAAASRKLIFLSGTTRMEQALWLLAAYLVLFATQPWLSRRFPRYHHVYLAISYLVVLALGRLWPYEDTWALLFFPLLVQIWRWYSSRLRILIGFIITLTMFASLMLSFDWWIGLGYSMFMFAVGYLIIAAVTTYLQVERERQESERLLAELRAAHERLQEYNRQIEEIAADQERNRMTRELHDAVSQLIFSISLLAQSTRLIGEKNPAVLTAHLGQLQELTGQALSQMRALISQWRPAAPSNPESM